MRAKGKGVERPEEEVGELAVLSCKAFGGWRTILSCNVLLALSIVQTNFFLFSGRGYILPPSSPIFHTHVFVP